MSARPRTPSPARLLGASLALAAAACADPPGWEAPALPAVDVEARVAPWVGGRARLLAVDGSELGVVALERCVPLPPSEVPRLVLDALSVAEDPGECPPLEAGTLAPLLAALEGGRWVREDLDRVDEEAALCTALREVLFGTEPVSTRPWLPLGDGTWLPLDDRDRLLAAHANLVDLGDGDFGVEAGARRWFGRGAADLGVAQAALVAALAASPDLGDDPRALRRSRDLVIDRLEARGLVDPRFAAAAADEPVPARPPHRDPPSTAPSFVAAARAELVGLLSGSLAGRQGASVRTTLDARLQDVAHRAMDAGRKRWEGNRKQEARQIRAVLAAFGEDPEKLAEAKVPDGAYAEVPEDKPSGAVLALEPATGRVRALYDGRLEAEVRERGALHMQRQAGSAFKTFIYAEAMAQGYSQADVFIDRRYAFKVPDRAEPWTPKNHLDKYYGTVTLRMALAQSLNSVAIQLAVKVGPQNVVRLCRRLGFRGRLKAVPALALGASPVTLGELVAAYGAFPSGGLRVQPRFVDRVELEDGTRIEFPPPPPERVLDPRVAHVMTNMLQAVVQGGTGTGARKLPFAVGGKTGTTNESKDTWFVGFSSALVVGVWLGFDDGLPLGGDETGGTLALPVWREVMAASAEAVPPADFEVPEGVEFRVLSPWNGQPWKEGRNFALLAPVRPRRVESHPRTARPLEKGEIPTLAGPRIRLLDGELKEQAALPSPDGTLELD